jgi:hypothetical protein
MCGLCLCSTARQTSRPRASFAIFHAPAAMRDLDDLGAWLAANPLFAGSMR